MRDDRVGDLERLSALWIKGALTDDEFARSKRHVLDAVRDDPPAAQPSAPRARREGLRRDLALRGPMGLVLLALLLIAVLVWLGWPTVEPRTADNPDGSVAPAASSAPRGDAVVVSAAPARGDPMPPSASWIAGGWAAAAGGCNLGARDPFEYFAADARYGGWGGFGGYEIEGSWKLDGTRLIETIVRSTSNNEAGRPQRLGDRQLRSYDITAATADAMTLTTAQGEVTSLVRCPDAHFEFSR